MQGDTFHMTCGGKWTFSENFSFPALTVWEWMYFKDLEETKSVSESMNDNGVCWTAPAILGLLNVNTVLMLEQVLCL